LKNKEGKCGEFATAMVSICRAKGIPARIVTGNIARTTDTRHTWVEVYFDEYGWVLYDPTVTDSTRKYYKNETFQKVERIYLPNENYIASIRNDLSPWYMTFSQINAGYTGDIKVTEDIQIREIK
jgi:transglutaminase-like putative cysteine protease